MRNRVGRDKRGRFVRGVVGGPGRPPGKVNSTTVDIRTLKRRILSTFDETVENGEPAGMVALRKLRDEEPKEYLRLIVPLLPPDDCGMQPSNSLQVLIEEMMAAKRESLAYAASVQAEVVEPRLIMGPATE